jgi:CDP-diglyceride synthetase
MAKPIKKGKSRISSGFSGKQVAGFIIGILFFIVVAFAVYWLYHNYTAALPGTSGGGNDILAPIQKFMADKGLQSSGLLILAIGGLLFAFIFNKK